MPTPHRRTVREPLIARVLATALWLLAAPILALPVPATAQVRLFAEEFDRADVIIIERDGRDLYGFDAVTGRRSSFRMDLGETVYFQESRGRVGLVLTDRRALALAPGMGFQEVRYRVHETPPERGLVEDQVALVATSKRVLGFLGNRGVWIEESLSPREAAAGIRVGAAVGVVATNRRALGISTVASRFVEAALRVSEDLESISSQDTLATIRTNRRILVFGTRGGGWSEQDRRLR
jgi:hypothetical protein